MGEDMTEFKDHFSKQSGAYGQYRPSYPESLFQYLSDQSVAHDLAWDCSTGTGQAARALCPYFKQVIATDASAEQVHNAQGGDNITFRQAAAESSGLADASVDLITVAQALHWFNHEAFYTEVKRVLKPGGLLCAWCYELMSVSSEIDALILEFYDGLIGPYWPPERRYIEQGYRSLPFPFQEGELPSFHMETGWDIDQILGYLGTWSATQRYKNDKGHDPVALIAEPLRALWGERGRQKIIWPLAIRLGVL